MRSTFVGSCSKLLYLSTMTSTPFLLSFFLGLSQLLINRVFITCTVYRRFVYGKFINVLQLMTAIISWATVLCTILLHGLFGKEESGAFIYSSTALFLSWSHITALKFPAAEANIPSLRRGRLLTLVADWHSGLWPGIPPPPEKRGFGNISEIELQSTQPLTHQPLLLTKNDYHH